MADNSYKIDISIDEELVRREKEHNIAKESQKSIEKEQEAVAKANRRMFAVAGELGLMATRELIVSKVGEVARDSLLQQKIDTGISVAQHALAFAVHPLIGVATVGISMASQTIDYNLKANQETRRLGIMRERAGFMNRSR